MKKIAATLCLGIVSLLAVPRPAHAIPEFPTNVLASCDELRSQDKVQLPQAVEMVNSCLKNIYSEDNGFSVTAEAGRFAVSLCPDVPPGGEHCAGMMEVEGIVVTINGKLALGNDVVRDLQYSLTQLNPQGKLLGYDATVVDKATQEY